MCGICGYIGLEDAIIFILKGIKILQNRGYDSAGIATIKKNKFNISKFASDNIDAITKLEKNLDLHKQSNIGISHTRWATHGAKNDINSHPHVDFKEQVILVHNGIIENYMEIKNNLISKGYKFKSETDTEVISNLISYYLDTGLTINEAIKKTQESMSGTWGCVLLYIETPDTMYIFRNGSPLLIGYSTDFCIVASEYTAFNNKVNNYISLPNKCIMNLIMKDNKVEQYIYENNKIEVFSKNKLIKEISNNNFILETPTPYNHWTIREIYEIPMSALRAINNGGRLTVNNVKLGGLESLENKLKKIEHLIIIACGSSLFAGQVGKKYFNLFKSFQFIDVIDATEFNINMLDNKLETGVLFISQSGETRDILSIINDIKQNNIITIGIVNAVASQIAELTDCGVYLNAGREVGVASTKSFINQCIILLLIAIWFSNIRPNNAINDIRNFTLLSSQTMNKYNQCKKIANLLVEHNNCFILSSGILQPIAHEASLKLKELSYIHSEGYSIGALKHGPFALIKQGTIIFYISTCSELKYCKKVDIAAAETQTRGATNILITDYDNHNNKYFDHIINVPKSGILSPCITLIIFQIIAYELSIQKNINPDKPRNLAKSVTVG